MITYIPEPSFKPFSVSFDINSREEAVAFINAVYTLSTCTRPDSWSSSEKATHSQMLTISDKMIEGKQWTELIGSIFKS